MDERRSCKLTAQCSPSRQEVCRTRPHRAARRAVIVSTTTAAVLIAAAACSHEAGHRVLVFFFDGVPPLETGVTDLAVETAGDALATTAIEPPQRVNAAKRFYNHPAYKQNRCPECHNVDGGTLIKTAREGLCQSCHPETPAKKKFVHGPVALNGCLACHLYHKSLHPKVLVADAQTLCFHCHEEGELRTDEHHATIKEERCIDCHDAHGGDDRFFLIPKADTVESS